MPHHFRVVRTTTANAHFQQLVRLLDHELWNELKEDQATYDQFNHVPDIKTAVLIYAEDNAVACGCFKPFDERTVEIKRMFVQKAFRGKGLSKMVLKELEGWAEAEGYGTAVLETSVHFTTACHLYEGAGYKRIANYPPYDNLADSVCMKKTFGKTEDK